MNLEHILLDLKQHKRNKKDLISFYIAERLNKSLNSYYKQLNANILFLKSKDDLKVLKNINKL